MTNAEQQKTDEEKDSKRQEVDEESSTHIFSDEGGEEVR